MGTYTAIMLVAGISGLLFHLCVARNIRALPDDPKVICPIHEELNEFNSTDSISNNTRLIDLGKIVGKKLKVQFYTPNPVKALAKHIEETTLTAEAYPYFVEDTSLATEIFPIAFTDEGQTTEAEVTTTLATTTTTEDPPNPPNILCEWEFLAANISEYILLTFHDMSAPYSEDCSDAYVSLQKDNGYESRWCGNRRQANARPMSLVSKTKAKITVYRRGKAPAFPPTGFTLSVESLDVFAMGGADNSLRILLG